MARNRKKKTAIGSFSEKDLEEPVRLVVQDEWSVRQAAVEKELSVQTVQGKIACNI
jgi:hypothetical protein